MGIIKLFSQYDLDFSLIYIVWWHLHIIHVLNDNYMHNRACALYYLKALLFGSY